MTEAIAYKKMLIERLRSLEGAIVLDYGCGRGDFIDLMLKLAQRPKCIYAVDSNNKSIANIKNCFVPEIKTGMLIPKICITPKDLLGLKFDKIICQNVLECIENKVEFINQLSDILATNGLCILSHHDFDSALYNSSNKDLTRTLIHHFADAKQNWMNCADGLMGRKIPGLVSQSIFKDNASIETWRIVEREFKPGMYGHLMAQMIQDIAKTSYESSDLTSWILDLEQKNFSGQYYFAIDLVVAVLQGKNE